MKIVKIIGVSPETVQQRWLEKEVENLSYRLNNNPLEIEARKKLEKKLEKTMSKLIKITHKTGNYSYLLVTPNKKCCCTFNS